MDNKVTRAFRNSKWAEFRENWVWCRTIEKIRFCLFSQLFSPVFHNHTSASVVDVELDGGARMKLAWASSISLYKQILPTLDKLLSITKPIRKKKLHHIKRNQILLRAKECACERQAEKSEKSVPDFWKSKKKCNAGRLVEENEKEQQNPRSDMNKSQKIALFEKRSVKWNSMTHGSGHFRLNSSQDRGYLATEGSWISYPAAYFLSNPALIFFPGTEHH